MDATDDQAPACGGEITAFERDDRPPVDRPAEHNAVPRAHGSGSRGGGSEQPTARGGKEDQLEPAHRREACPAEHERGLNVRSNHRPT